MPKFWPESEVFFVICANINYSLSHLIVHMVSHPLHKNWRLNSHVCLCVVVFFRSKLLM